MSATPGRAKRLESAISICLLAILFLIGLGILIKQFDADMSRFGIDATGPELSAQKPRTNAQVEMALDAFAPAGFKALSQPEIYTSGNLYEKINGKADFYIDTGFEQLSTRRFISKDKENLWVELFVYDMGSIRNAFSVYSRQKRPDVRPFPNVQFGYKTGNALYFVHGKYYIELVGSTESDELTKAATEVAQKIRANLPVDKAAHIAELSIFPLENLIPDSFKLYLTDTFGFEELTDTFTARYKLDDEIVTAFFSKRSDPKQAQTIAQSYYSFLTDSGCSNKTTTNQTLANLKANVVDSYGTTEIVLAAGPFVAGVHEADNQQAAERLAEILAIKLSHLAGREND
ncbi:MAG: DUF6599 family protein [Planctomycetota bacterium]|jgi:hypothetical protein